VASVCWPWPDGGDLGLGRVVGVVADVHLGGHLAAHHRLRRHPVEPRQEAEVVEAQRPADLGGAFPPLAPDPHPDVVAVGLGGHEVVAELGGQGVEDHLAGVVDRRCIGGGPGGTRLVGLVGVGVGVGGGIS